MGNFARDYFGTGLNNTFRNTLGTILAGIKTKGLLNFVTGNSKDKQKDVSSNPVLNDVVNTYDSGYRTKDGKPMQDLDVQPKPDYSQPPQAGGDSSGETSVLSPEEQAMLTQLQDKPSTNTEQPVQDSNYILQQVAGQNEIPLLKGKDKSKVIPNALLKDIASENRDSFNQDLMKRVLETQVYNTRFGDVGKEYNDIASSVLQGYYQHAPTEPKFDEKKMFSDASGNLYQYKYNFYTGTYDAVPVAGDDTKQIQTDLPKFDEKRIQVTMDGKGNAVLYDMQSGKTINTGQQYTNFDPYYALKERDISLDEAYKMGMLDIAQSKALLGNKGNRSRGNDNNGSSNSGSNFSINPKTNQLEVDGVPLEPTSQTIGTGKFITDANGVPMRNEDGSPKQQTETVQGYNINGKFISMADVDRIVGQVGKKGLTPYQRMQLNFYGIDVDKSGNFIDKTKTQEKKKENDWKKIWDEQYKAYQNPKSKGYAWAKEWLSKKENRDYARKLGLIP